MKTQIFTVILLLSCNCFALSDEQIEIEQRIKPVGKVRIQGSEENQVKKEVEKVEVVKKEPGQEIYETYCATCHANGIAGAPKFRSADWQPHLAQGMDVLLKNATTGIRAMPPKGTCAECTEEDLKAAILYMTQAKK